MQWISAAKLVLLTLAVCVTVTSQAVKEGQAPVTPRPQTPEWRLGFDLGNVVILETPELNPQDDEGFARREAQRLLPAMPNSLGLMVLPFANERIASQRFVNTLQWAVLDQHGNVRQLRFSWLGAFAGNDASNQGGYHLVSSASIVSTGLVKPDRAPSADNIVFGLAGLSGLPPQVRTRLTQTPWRNGLPVESPDDLPDGYANVKTILDASPENGVHRIVYGSSMKAMVNGRVEKVWLLNYGAANAVSGPHSWGIFVEEPTGLRSLFASSGNYHADIYAGIDADRDGNDDLLVQARYDRGTAYLVIARINGEYRQTRTSYRRSP